MATQQELALRVSSFRVDLGALWTASLLPSRSKNVTVRGVKVVSPVDVVVVVVVVVVVREVNVVVVDARLLVTFPDVASRRVLPRLALPVAWNGR